MTRFASVPGARLAYEVAGAGDPPMVFVHGWCGDRSHFAPQVRHFAAGHAVAAVDLRGHGDSDRPAPGHFIQLEVPDQVNAMIERFLAITGLSAHR
jgi:pimeloyl-ACP methyl ester carboxylesterase